MTNQEIKKDIEKVMNYLEINNPVKAYMKLVLMRQKNYLGDSEQ